MEANPKILHWSLGSLTLAALGEAYPCHGDIPNDTITATPSRSNCAATVAAALRSPLMFRTTRVICLPSSTYDA